MTEKLYLFDVVDAGGRAVLYSPDMDRILAAAGQRFDVSNMVA